MHVRKPCPECRPEAAKEYRQKEMKMSCLSTHPTETDIVLAQAPRNGIMSPVVGPDGKNVIERHPLRCWHGIGHEGKHGYGHITWTDKKET